MIPFSAPERADTLSVGANQTTGFVGEAIAWWDGGQTAASLTTRSHDQFMPDKDNFAAVIQAVRTANTSANGHGVADDVAHTIDGANGQAIAFTNRGYDAPSEHVADSLRAGSHGALPMVAATLTSNGDAQNGHRDEHGLIATATMDVHPTLSAQTGGPGSQDWQQHSAVATSMAVRRLTPVECCRLQAFPDDWLDLDPPLADSTKYRMLGNSVCVNVTEWLARRIAATPTEP